MTRRNKNGEAAPLSDFVLRQLAESLQPIPKNETTIFRRNERVPLFSVEAPGYARCNAHAIRLIGECAVRWGLESRYPQALQAMKGSVPGYVVLKPVAIFDQNIEDQYKINWNSGFKKASTDLLPILQPRNLEVPKGYVSEMPVSLQELPGAGFYIIIHTGEVTVRKEGELDRQDRAESEGTQEDRADTEAAATKED